MSVRIRWLVRWLCIRAVLSVRDFTGNVGSACRGECYRFRERRVFVERQYDLCESGALLSLWEDASLRRVDYPERDSTGGGRLLGSFSRGVGRGVRMLREAGVEVVTGVMEEEARALNKAFMTLQTKGRPILS